MFVNLRLIQEMLVKFRYIFFYKLQAFRTIKCFLGKLEKVSENPELSVEAGKHWTVQKLEVCMGRAVCGLGRVWKFT